MYRKKKSQREQRRLQKAAKNKKNVPWHILRLRRVAQATSSIPPQCDPYKKRLSGVPREPFLTLVFWLPAGGLLSDFGLDKRKRERYNNTEI